MSKLLAIGQWRYWGSGLLAALSFTLTAKTVTAQPQYPACQPPTSSEYLLLVVSKTEASREQIRQVLPANTETTVCNYLDNIVMRVGGFTNLAVANSWTQYINQVVGLSAFVARPAEVPPPRNIPAYNPQPLGPGYAVLVDYLNRPEVAAQVQELVKRDVGLVSYGQRPYLLAFYTPNQGSANTTLQALSDRGFWTMLVDSRKVILLRSAVK